MKGILGLLLLVLDIWAILRVIGAKADGLKKLLWIIVILLFPLLGVILWFVLGGPGAKGK